MIKVLDHGYVKFIGAMGTEETIIEAARMSTGKGFQRWDAGEVCAHCGHPREVLEQHPKVDACLEPSMGHAWKRVDGDQKLLAFLYGNGHLTPFEMCELAIEVQAPLMVFREWHRHRTQSYNEFSARYAPMPDLHYVPALERFRPTPTANKQAGAVAAFTLDEQHCAEDLQHEQAQVYQTYERLLEGGVPKEVARLNTPVSRYSKMRAKANLRNWLGFLNLRLRPNAQWEIRQYAEAVSKVIQGLWPKTHALFLEHTLNAVTLSASEAYEVRMYLEEFRGARALDSIFKKLEVMP